jgi:hypothetical protein
MFILFLGEKRSLLRNNQGFGAIKARQKTTRKKNERK